MSETTIKRKVFSSKCGEYFAIEKDDQNVVFYPVDSITDVYLDDNKIVIKTGDAIILEAHHLDIDVPYIAVDRGREKVVYLHEWLICRSNCPVDDACSGGYYYDNLGSISIDVPYLSDTSYTGDWYYFEPRFTFPDDMTCDNAYEVHFHINFEAGNFASNTEVIVSFWIDGVEITHGKSSLLVAKTFEFFINSSFVVEGDKSGKLLQVGIGSNDSTTNDITTSIIDGNLFVKKIK